MKILLDTNCLLMILPKKSAYHWVLREIRSGNLELVVTTEILAEYEEILGRFYSPEYATMILKALLNLANVIKLNPIYFQWQLINIDKDDNKFVDAYIASNADLVITYDKHFNVLNNIKFPKEHFCNLDDFKKNIGVNFHERTKPFGKNI